MTQVETYLYATKGVEICGGADGVDTFTVIFDPGNNYLVMDAKGALPYRGKILHGREFVELSRDTSENDFVDMFGEPYWRDVDEDEALLFYEFGQVEWQAEFDHEAGLTSLIILSPPLLADEKQRAAFKVDKPWPPGWG